MVRRSMSGCWDAVKWPACGRSSAAIGVITMANESARIGVAQDLLEPAMAVW